MLVLHLPGWDLDVQNWNQLPSEVFECYLFLKSGFRTRFQPSKHRLTDAALDLVHPGHKNLSWLSGVERIQAHSLIKEELFSVAGVDILMLPMLLMISLMSNLQEKVQRLHWMHSSISICMICR